MRFLGFDPESAVIPSLQPFFSGSSEYDPGTLLLSEAREKAGFTGSMQTLLSTFNNIRLALVFEKKKKKNGNRKVTYKLEELSKKEEKLMSSLGLQKLHKRKIKMSGVGVYK
ncbi:MAG: hypothetical protein KAR40_10060 [Candidatus Sabulitectum sp.]|nr:hypothetical protein [Candidatus Sabulitectum sp.]